jgi:hypothetical protein
MTYDVPNPDEYAKATRKVQFLAGRHGQNYSFSAGKYNEPEQYGSRHIVMNAPDGSWAGEMQWDSSDGTVSHLYVEKSHRQALPALLSHAITLTGNDEVPPYTSSSLTPRANRMAKSLLPKTAQGIVDKDDNYNYEK